MALRGTLKDFGIADIFQLIGHQQKTGTLTVRERGREVRIVFKDGNIVRAHSATRKEREMLGSLLKRAEIIDAAQLESALEIQRSTGKRVGDILVENAIVDRQSIQAFMRLQTHETVYQLFLWNAGTYEFEQGDVEVEQGLELIRSENVLMEGFRQVDEWPLIRKKISGYGVTWKRIEDLDALMAQTPQGSGDEINVDDAFGDLAGESKTTNPRLKGIGANERTVYHLAIPGRDVQKIIDLSRLGEFETCKSLVSLIDARIIAATEAGDSVPSAAATIGGINARLGSLRPALGRLVAFLLICAGLAAMALHRGLAPRQLSAAEQELGYVDQSLQTLLGRAELARLASALDLYYAEAGEYPAELDRLVEARLIHPRQLHHPWKLPYYYARREGGYELLRPLY